MTAVTPTCSMKAAQVPGCPGYVHAGRRRALVPSQAPRITTRKRPAHLALQLVRYVVQVARQAQQSVACALRRAAPVSLHPAILRQAGWTVACSGAQRWR